MLDMYTKISFFKKSDWLCKLLGIVMLNLKVKMVFWYRIFNVTENIFMRALFCFFLGLNSCLILAQSPLKATDSLAHRELPFQSSIDYFDLENKESFLNALNAALKKLNDNIQKDFSTLTLHHRMEKVINFITDRPEGPEPS